MSKLKARVSPLPPRRGSDQIKLHLNFWIPLARESSSTNIIPEYNSTFTPPTFFQSPPHLIISLPFHTTPSFLPPSSIPDSSIIPVRIDLINRFIRNPPSSISDSFASFLSSFLSANTPTTGDDKIGRVWWRTVSNSLQSEALEFSSDKRAVESRAWARWILPRDDRISMATKGDTRVLDNGERHGGGGEARLLDWLHQQFPKTFERTTDTWHFDVLTWERDVSFCGVYPFDRSIPTLADIGSRATPPPATLPSNW